MFIDKETYLKSGLAKSAFKETIYRQLPLDYYVPSLDETSKLCRRLHKVMPKFYQSHDAFLMFYQPYDVVFQSLKKANRAAPVWRDVIESAISKDEFYKLNSITQGSTELSVIAAVKFLKNLLAKTDFEVLHRALQQLQQGGQQAQQSQLSQYTQSAVQEGPQEGRGGPTRSRSGGSGVRRGQRGRRRSSDGVGRRRGPRLHKRRAICVALLGEARRI